MVVAIRAGGGPDVWLAHPRALVTALEVLEEADAAARRKGV